MDPAKMKRLFAWMDEAKMYVEDGDAKSAVSTLEFCIDYIIKTENEKNT